MPSRRSRRQDWHSFSGCPLPNKFDESYERFRENFKKISRRCASVACMPGSPDDVVIDMNDLTAISKTPNFPALATFGSGSSKLCFPDFSWTSATTKRPTVDDNCPCDEPTDICMSRCNSSKLAFSMFEKSSICTVQRKAKYHETVLQNILDEEETETEPLTLKNDIPVSPVGNTVEPQKPSKPTKPKESGKTHLKENCCTKKRTGRKIIDQGDAEEEEVGPRFRSKEKTAVKKDANVAAPSKDCERKAGKSKVEPAKVRQKSEVKAESKTALAPLADKQMRKVAVKKKSARNERIFKLRFETFPAIVTDAVEVPVPQESMLCEPRQRTTSDFPSAEEDVMRLGYLFDHLRLTQDRIQLWLNLQGETYPRHKK